MWGSPPSKYQGPGDPELCDHNMAAGAALQLRHERHQVRRLA